MPRTALAELPGLLVREGYVDAYQVFGVFHSRLEVLRRSAGELPQRLATLVRLFLLGERSPADAVVQVLSGAVVAALVAAQVLDDRPGGLALEEGLVLAPLLGRFAFVPLRAPAGLLGGEQAALMPRLRPPGGGLCIDVTADTGALALHLASAGARVIAVDRRARSLAIARVNLALAAADEHGRVELRQGDLWLPAAGERFERLAATPVALPLPRGLSAEPDPGPEGFAEVRRVLHALPRILAPRGTAHIVALALGDGGGPHLRTTLTRLARELDLALVWTLPSRLGLQPGSRGLRDLTAACADLTGQPASVVAPLLERHLATTGADHLYPYFLTASRARASEPAGLREHAHYREPGGLWFR